MSVSEQLKSYLEARFEGLPTDDIRKRLVSEAETLFDTVRRDRQPFDAKWYQNQRFMDGDHYLTFDPQTGKINNQDFTQEGKATRIKRSINVMKAQIRGLKNFVLKVPLTVEISPAPTDDSPEAKQIADEEARGKSNVVLAIEHKLKLKELRRPIVDDGFLKNAAYVVVLPTEDGFVSVKNYDSYDVFPDPTAPTFFDGYLLFLATRQNLATLKQNKAYENTGELKGDSKLAASTFKNNYERSRSGAQQALTQGDLESCILKQLLIKLPFTQEDVMEPVVDHLTGQPAIDPTTGQPQTQPVVDQDTGEPKKKLVETKDGKTRIWIVTFTAQELHRVEETNFSRWPAIRYVPEQTGNRVHGNAWATDLQDPNRTVDNMVSKAEEWHIKASPKLMVPSDSKLKEVTNVTADVLEYDPRKADGIKDYMPSGVPPSMFTLVNLAQGFVADVGGMHPASGGSVPVGVKSGRGIESLQAADAEFNMAEPMENFGLMWQEMWERILEIISENTVSQMTLPYQDSGSTRKVTFIGKAGLTQKNGTEVSAPQGVVVIGESHVNVRTVPEVSYSEDGKKEILKELYDIKAIDLKTLLEGYRFSNVGDIMERVIAENEKKSQMPPPPPPPVPADRLLNALANVAKSGQPITFEQLQTAMKDATLPPAQNPTAPPVVPQPVAPPIDGTG